MGIRTVLLYGRSLLMSLVANRLQHNPDLRVAQAATWTEARRLMADSMPEALIFDLTDACESHILPLLFKNPHLQMIGLDTECNRAVLLSGQEAQALTLDQISEIIERE
jgi:hypothetical protein